MVINPKERYTIPLGLAVTILPHTMDGSIEVPGATTSVKAGADDNPMEGG